MGVVVAVGVGVGVTVGVVVGVGVGVCGVGLIVPNRWVCIVHWLSLVCLVDSLGIPLLRISHRLGLLSQNTAIIDKT